MAQLYKRKATGTWYVRARKDGRDIKVSLGTASKEDAKRRKLIWEAENEGDKWREVKWSFADAVFKVTEEHYPTLKPKSRRAYTYHLLSLSNHFEGKMLHEIGKASLYDYEQARRKDGVSLATITAEFAVLSTVFGVAAESDWIEINPVPTFLKARRKKGLVAADPRTRYLSHEEEHRLLQACRELDRQAFPEADLWAAAFIIDIDTGLREEELLGLPWADVDMVRKEITVRAERAKSGKERRVPILPRAEKVLKALRRSFSSPYVIQRQHGQRYDTLLRQVKLVAERASIEDLTFHDLRRTAGCRLLQDHRLQMHEVSRWLGHSSVSVTERTYAFLTVETLHDRVGTIRDQLPVNETEETEETISKIKAIPHMSTRLKS